MNPKYVTSLGTSMKLKLAGVPQKSEWYWEMTLFPDGTVDYSSAHLCTKENRFLNLYDKTLYWISAFHCGELGDMLPWMFHRQSEMPFTLEIRKMIQAVDEPMYEWTVRYVRGDEQMPCTADTEAEARGKMLLYLIENKLISFEAKASESEGV